MPTLMKPADLRRFAIAGAEARLLAIAEEAAAIYRVFPELRVRGRSNMPVLDGKSAAKGHTVQPTKQLRARKRHRMTRAQRQAVGERMKKYWASRRIQAKGPKQRATESNGHRSARRGGVRRMSAAARKRISEAQKKRWAKQRTAK